MRVVLHQHVSIINTRAQEQTEQELCVEARAFARVKVSARRGCLHVYLLIGVTNTRRYNLYPRARAAMQYPLCPLGKENISLSYGIVPYIDHKKRVSIVVTNTSLFAVLTGDHETLAG